MAKKTSKTNKAVFLAALALILVLLFLFTQGRFSLRKESPDVSVTGEFPKSKSGETLTAEDLQRAVNTAPAFLKLGKDSKILVKFYDGNGAELGQPRFLVRAGGAVEEITGFTFYDIALVTGDYYINEIKSTNDLCALLRRINGNQDFNVELKTDPITAQARYGVLNECVPF